jgi:hypothetical protein
MVASEEAPNGQSPALVVSGAYGGLTDALARPLVRPSCREAKAPSGLVTRDVPACPSRRGRAVQELSALERSGRLSVVIKRVGADVVAAVPRGRRDSVPPGVSIWDTKALDSTRDFDRLVGLDCQTRVPAGVEVVAPRLRGPSSGFGVARPDWHCVGARRRARGQLRTG